MSEAEAKIADLQYLISLLLCGLDVASKQIETQNMHIEILEGTVRALQEEKEKSK